MDESVIQQAAEAIKCADSMIIGAGAGMGVDSGLPDFRGSAGFWQAYPALKGKDFTQMANPAGFKSNPKQAWGFYGHRLNLYRETVPHQGFHQLKQLAEGMPNGYQVFTSNVDGQFQLAGFDEHRIYECHGSIHHLQCARPCGGSIWSADYLKVKVDESKCLAASELPQCPQCNAIARPNILMFGDYAWNSERSDEQQRRMVRNIQTMKNPVIIELGAGVSVPTVRYFCESQPGFLIRINPRDCEINTDGVVINLGAKSALSLICEYLDLKPET